MHGLEVLLEAEALDHAQMVYDFGLLKGSVGDFIDAFDHPVTFNSMTRKPKASASRVCSAL
ncbi:MAG: hypothetical protein ACRCTL_10430 [Pseudomonas sp.]